jgi:hypothetical protein
MATDRTTEFVIENREQLVEALRSRKEFLGLSNAWIEAQLHMTDGGADKILGPSQAKGFSVAVLFDLVELFGARLVIRVDAESEARMATRWERRDERAVRSPKRISQKLLELAQPIIQQKLGRAGGLKRAACLPAKQRSRIARAAALSRWKQHRAALKAASVSEGASA